MPRTSKLQIELLDMLSHRSEVSYWHDVISFEHGAGKNLPYNRTSWTRCLRLLESKGLVTSKWGVSEPVLGSNMGRRVRRYCLVGNENKPDLVKEASSAKWAFTQQ